MRAAAARDAEILKKTIGFSTISTSDFNKTYENTIFSHRRTSENFARAHVLKLSKNQWFFNIPLRGAFAGNFCARFELLQRHSRARQGHSPCPIIQCGAHARGRRASNAKSLKLICFSTLSTSDFTGTYENTIFYHRGTSKCSDRAHMRKPETRRVFIIPV